MHPREELVDSGSNASRQPIAADITLMLQVNNIR